MVSTWQKPLVGLLQEVASVARAGGMVRQMDNIAAKAELAAVAESLLLLFSTGDRRRSTSYASLLSNKMGVVCLADPMLQVTRNQARLRVGNSRNVGFGVEGH